MRRRISTGLADAGAALMRLLPPETAHRVTLGLLERTGAFFPAAERDDPRLGIDVLGLHFPNPIGLAAGFDKDGRVPDAMAKFGFGFVELGTVTPKPQAGNPRPRLFRLGEDRAVVNRMGFNNEGMDAMARRLAARAPGGIVGINVGANKDSADRSADYARAFARLAPFASYVTVNVSSPNTPGLRGLQNKSELAQLLALLAEARAKSGLRVPLLLKIAPDVEPSSADDIAEVSLASGIEGLIVSNTTIARPSSLKSRHAHQSGGLSGAPLFVASTALLRGMRARVGTRLVLVGAGGIVSGADVYAKLRAGASLVQLYTALAYEGPGLIARLKRELLDCLAREGLPDVRAAIGAGVA
jgi:dihydroorotate dehydrogenase